MLKLVIVRSFIFKKNYAISMLLFSCIYGSSVIALLCFEEGKKPIPDGLLLAWLAGAIVLIELTLLDSLREQRLSKKVVFACLLHFVPVLPLVGYWWWKVSSRSSLDFKGENSDRSSFANTQ